jgi:hypothetical protein
LITAFYTNCCLNLADGEEVAVKLSERRATLLGIDDPDGSRVPSPKWLRRT